MAPSSLPPLLMVFNVEVSNLFHAQPHMFMLNHTPLYVVLLEFILQLLSVRVLTLCQSRLQVVMYPFQLILVTRPEGALFLHSTDSTGHWWSKAYYLENRVQFWLGWWYPCRNECSLWCYLYPLHVVCTVHPNLWFQSSPAGPQWPPESTSSQSLWRLAAFELQEHSEVLTRRGYGQIYQVGAGQWFCMLI